MTRIDHAAQRCNFISCAHIDNLKLWFFRDQLLQLFGVDVMQAFAYGLNEVVTLLKLDLIS